MGIASEDDSIDEMVEVHERVYFGVRCEVFTTKNTLKWYRPFPWRFRIYMPSGSVTEYYGVPNYCETRRQATMRAKHRCKWISEGTYDEHYKCR